VNSIYPNGSEVAAHQTAGVTLIAANGINSLGSERLSAHGLFMPQTRNVCVDLWQGNRMTRREWSLGDLCFIPDGSDIHSYPEIPYNELALKLDDRLFVSAAVDHIDYSAIDFHYADVTEKSTQMLSSAMVHIATTERFSEWPLLVETNAMSLVIAVICALSPRATTAFKEKPYGMGESRTKLVTDYIDANLHRQISLQELAELASLSPFHFCRKFKKRVGMTPLAYLAQRRVDKAKKQMRTRGDTLAQVALDCGFASQSHFTTVFRTVTGTTPGQYRKTIA
jgi:AraC family transcriptional regulator